MAQFNHRIDLKETKMPMLSSELGRTVLVSNNKNTATGEKSNEPEIVYMHNVMPTDRGLQSVGFKEIHPAISNPNPTTRIEGVLSMPTSKTALGVITYDRKDFLFYDSWSTAGNDLFYALKESSNSISTAVGLSSTIYRTKDQVFSTHINGITYILVGIYVYYKSSTSNAIVLQAFTNAPSFIARLSGMLSSFGYLILWEKLGNKVAWSSLIDPLDFLPSAVTGAGEGAVQDLIGDIIYCRANSKGFIIYGRENAVAAIYTGNKQYPFSFKAIPGSKGLPTRYANATEEQAEYNLVASAPGSLAQFTYTLVGGLQIVTAESAKPILPEITDFLSGRVIEDFDETTKTFNYTEVPYNSYMRKMLNYIGGRYLIISYGITEFTHALIYDLVLKRVGKIKFTHNVVIEYIQRARFAPSATSINGEPAKESLAFVKSDGSVHIMQYNIPSEARSGVLILGKYQYHRDRMLHLQEVTVENIAAIDTFSLTDSVSLDGRNEASKVSGVETVGTVGYREYRFPSTAGKNHSLIFIGKFIMNSLELLFTLGGRR